jgi:hypothetical protein
MRVINQEKYLEFAKVSGLKKYKISEVIGISVHVLFLWLNNRTRLSPRQQLRLDVFVTDFCRNNAYMDGVDFSSASS